MKFEPIVMQVCKILRRQFYRGGAGGRLSPSTINSNDDRSALRAMRAGRDDGHGQTSAHARPLLLRPFTAHGGAVRAFIHTRAANVSRHLSVAAILHIVPDRAMPASCETLRRLHMASRVIWRLGLRATAQKQRRARK